MKKTLALVLAMLQLVLVLAACGEKTPAADPDAGSVTSAEIPAEETTAELTESERRALISDDLPDTKFDGKPFTIITLAPDLYEVEEMSGAALNDAIYERNAAIQNRFDTTIKAINAADRHALRGIIQQAIRAGDNDTFQLVSYHMADNGANAVAGLYLDWYTVPHIDFEKPWWGPSNVEDLTINGKCFVAIGDACINAVQQVWCLLFNKQLAEDMQVGDLYEMVNSGEWTIDRIKEISAASYVDANGNGTSDADDVFGFGVTQGSAANTFLWAFDNPIIKKDASGQPQYVMNTEKLPDILSTVVGLYSQTGIYPGGFNDGAGLQQIFCGGNIMIITATFAGLATNVGEVDFDIGVLPFPKLNLDQPDYHTMVDGGADSMGVSIAASDLEFIGTITEALCAETYKSILPVYYDIMLKNRYADRPEDAKMMDLIVDSRTFDVGYIYDNWLGAGFWMQELVRNNTTNIASYMAKAWPAAQKYYDKVLALFQ